MSKSRLGITLTGVFSLVMATAITALPSQADTCSVSVACSTTVTFIVVEHLSGSRAARVGAAPRSNPAHPVRSIRHRD
ncbi:hypothetical protein [Streptosporangium roseum]|uniref:hypothetical protein n=1 Tax=Streptosporangium roseum TaxID=2001 RepID=UPI0005B93C43|nr:hypothetical protein [Streptosporangium roseum]